MCLPFPLSRNVLAGEDHDITALMTQGAALWLGTRTGYILLLDPSALVDGQNPLLGLQYYGKGKVKFIRPLVSSNKPTSKLEVVCSVEYEDEVSGVLLAWEFHPLQQWRAKEHHLNSGSLPTSPTSPLSSVHTNLIAQIRDLKVQMAVVCKEKENVQHLCAELIALIDDSQFEALEPKMVISAPTLESSLERPDGIGLRFNLPDMRLHHHLHLQDAVLSLCALNGCGVHYGGDEMKYCVLLGLANGTIILFFGINQGKVVPNPLQGPKLQMFTTGRKPCLNMCPTSNGYIWCSCGDSLELLDIVSLKSLRKLDALVVAVGAARPLGGCVRGRRSTLLRLWDAVTGAMKASYNVRNVLAGEDHDITALMTHGAALWLGTRTGYILLLDPSALVDGQNPLLGLQYCGKGKVKFIRPLVSPNKPTSKLEVVCSVEYEDEVSGVLLAWEFHPCQQWRAKEHHLNSGSLSTSPTSPLSPVHTNTEMAITQRSLPLIESTQECLGMTTNQSSYGSILQVSES
eukprot:Em0022g632a